MCWLALYDKKGLLTQGRRDESTNKNERAQESDKNERTSLSVSRPSRSDGGADGARGEGRKVPGRRSRHQTVVGRKRLRAGRWALGAQAGPEGEQERDARLPRLFAAPVPCAGGPCPPPWASSRPREAPCGSQSSSRAPPAGATVPPQLPRRASAPEDAGPVHSAVLCPPAWQPAPVLSPLSLTHSIYPPPSHPPPPKWRSQHATIPITATQRCACAVGSPFCALPTAARLCGTQLHWPLGPHTLGCLQRGI
ncbi:hypothetical protein BDZ91DRAFT_841754 [Kalaharituber pfeilii]|nr:hypothetical protein BDZ91DRAFT_841754 [Kalaharituber pfeilii]